MPVKRQIPRPHDLRPLIQFKKPEVSWTRRRLDAALTIGDLRNIAKSLVTLGVVAFARESGVRRRSWLGPGRVVVLGLPGLAGLRDDGAGCP
jgi:hypothetical protein